MSKVFFTGCQHYDHDNIIELAGRPCTDVNDMNHLMAALHNSVVGDNDEVFMLGDFTYDPKSTIPWPDRAAAWNKMLRGRKYLILGNHDDLEPWREYDEPSEDTGYTNCGFSGVYRYLNLKRKGKHFVLFHYPMEDWDGRYKGSIHLHCHTHQKQLERPLLPYVENSGLTMESDANLTLPARYPDGQYCNRFNVTVEATNYTPISLDEIVARSVYKEHIPI